MTGGREAVMPSPPGNLPPPPGGPTCATVAAKACLQVVAMLGMAMPMAYIYVIAAGFEPYKRGFFCDDENLKHPYKEQTVPISICFVIWACISIFLILLVETLRALAESNREKPIKNNPTPWIAVELYRQFGYFVLGALCCLLFTEMAKYTIGRLRPHFLSVCDPELTDQLCKDSQGYMKFVELDNEELICRGIQNGHLSMKELHEARLSFLSGHSSFSFFCATFLVVYLQARLTNFPKTRLTPVRIIYRFLKILRPFFQFGMIILAFWIALTRISNYFHHPTDVVAGGLVGVLFATVTLLVCADIFNKQSAFWQNHKCGPESAKDESGLVSVTQRMAEKKDETSEMSSLVPVKGTIVAVKKAPDNLRSDRMSGFGSPAERPRPPNYQQNDFRRTRNSGDRSTPIRVSVSSSHSSQPFAPAFTNYARSTSFTSERN